METLKLKLRHWGLVKSAPWRLVKAVGLTEKSVVDLMARMAADKAILGPVENTDEAEADDKFSKTKRRIPLQEAGQGQ